MSIARLQDLIVHVPHEEVTVGLALSRGVHVINPDWEGLQERMLEGPLRLYLGIDPTAPNLHIGHLVPLRKLAQLHQLGHNVILLFGTFTGMIGDPSDKAATRRQLTMEEVTTNVATYKQQAGRVLNFDDPNNPVNIVYNHEWLEPLSLEDSLNMASQFTVQQFLERRSFRERIENGQPIYLHELMYPLLQGYDSVALGVELEIGGRDQLFNMLVGRDMVNKYFGGQQKWCLATKLIEDPNGQKMGKTTGNVVNIEEPPEVIYEALMTWPDSTIALGLELLTLVPEEVIDKVQEAIANGENPMYLKESFTYRVIAELHGEAAAQQGREIFNVVKRNGEFPPNTKRVVSDNRDLRQILVTSGLASELDEADSRIREKAVFINGTRSTSQQILSPGEYQIQLGKRAIKNARVVDVL